MSSNPLFPSLGSYINLQDLPKVLTGLQGSLQDVLSNVLVKNIDLTTSNNGVQINGQAILLILGEIKLNLPPNTGFILSLNPPSSSFPTGTTEIKVEFVIRNNWRMFASNKPSLPTSGEAIFTLIANIIGSSDYEIFEEALYNYTYDASIGTLVADINAANQGANFSVPNNTTIEEDLLQLIDEIDSSLNLSPATVVFRTYLNTTNHTDSSPQQEASNFFQRWLGESPLKWLINQLIPQIDLKLNLGVGLTFPNNILKPINDPARLNPPQNVTFIASPGPFRFSTDGNFGYEIGVNITSDPPRAEIGNTGFIIDLYQSVIKLDLSDESNIPEAQVDRRPIDFKGIYISSVRLFLPKDWQIQGNAVEIHGYNLLIGTGGFSGTLGIAGTDGLPKPPSTDPNNPLLSVKLFNDVQINFNSFDVTFQQDVVIHSNVKGKFSIASLKGANNQPAWFNFELLFNANGFELIFEDTANAVNVTLGNTIKLSISRMVIGRDHGDLFMGLTAVVEMQQELPLIGKVLPKKIKFDRLLLSQDSSKNNFAANVEWPDGTQVTGNLNTGLEISVALQKVILDTIRVDLVRLRLQQSASKTEALITTNTQLKLGPMAEFADPKTKRGAKGFVAIIEDFGLKLSFEPDENGGNIGAGNLDVRIKYPKGIGVQIDTQNVKGGGFLSFDEAKGEYIGVAALKVRDKLDLKAIGILITKKNAPGDPEYSLFLLVTAEGFRPIPLGMGFTLNGVGGLVGINRSLNEQRLRQGVQDNSLSYLLFPKDPIGDAPQIIASAGQAFPVANGRYAFGLMGKIAWGANALITLDLGLIIEVPSPVRIAILGVLKAVLPSENNAKLKLQVNFLGFIDFDKKQISFDASLFDSKLLDSTLTGDMAFRLYQGEKPVFLVTVGGFHPAFTPPPANLPTLRRLVMTVVNRSNLKMIMESYFALTSNTVQFGCRLDMRAEIGDFAVVGYFSFDTLFQFNPFQLILDIAAEVAIKYGSKTLLSLYLSLHLDGPSPWHVTGKASFSAFGFKVEKSIDKTIGDQQPEALPAQVNVRQQLVAALSDIANWEVEQGANTFDLVTTRPITATQGRLFVNPAGQLVVRQKVAPLKYRFDKFGNSVPVNGNEFDITQATFGAGAGNSAPLSAVEDAFAPAQFRSMSNEEKLAAPSFQRMKNGVRFKATEDYKGGAGVVKPLAYEVVVLEKANPATLPLDQAEAGFVSLGSQGEVPLNQHMFRGFSRNSAASRSSLSKEQSAPSKLAPDAVYWDQDRYAVVYKSNLGYYEGEAEYGSEAEADAYLKKLLDLKPELENELQVIPVYELDHQMELA